MILVKTKVGKVFDSVETAEDIKSKLRSVVSLERYKKLIDTFETQGKIKRRKVVWKQDDVNWVYESNIVYINIEAQEEIFQIFQDVLHKLVLSGFEVEVKIRKLSKLLDKSFI